MLQKQKGYKQNKTKHCIIEEKVAGNAEKP
jgi:hypothetical protein